MQRGTPATPRASQPAGGAADQGYALPPGYELMEYRITRLLGAGGFGMTYLAEDTNLAAPVAIKEYLPHDVAVRDHTSTVRPRTERQAEDYRWGVDRFLEEAQTLARFRHHHIVRVRRMFQSNGTAYIVMDYEDGHTLKDHLRELGRPMLEEEAVALAVPVAQGLAVVHQGGFLHRDIKPGNIIIRPDRSPVLVDFGSARQAIEQRTRSITSILTPGYAPVEQYTTRGKQGPWTDIYGLGAVLHLCLTTRAPLESVERIAALNAGEPDPQPPLAESEAGLYSQQLLEAVDWAMRIDAASRPQTVADWLAVFAPEATLASGGAGPGEEDATRLVLRGATRASERQPTSPRSAPRSAPGAAPGAAAGAAPLSVPRAAQRSVQPPVSRRPAFQPATRPARRRGPWIGIGVVLVLLAGLAAAAFALPGMRERILAAVGLGAPPVERPRDLIPADLMQGSQGAWFVLDESGRFFVLNDAGDRMTDETDGGAPKAYRWDVARQAFVDEATGLPDEEVTAAWRRWTGR